MKTFRAAAAALTLSCTTAFASDIETLIPWLLDEDRQLENLSFSEVLKATTGYAIKPVDPASPATRRVLQHITIAARQVMETLNAPDSLTAAVGRVNEVSRYFEDALQKSLDAVEDLECRHPPTAEGHTQRSGYPDLEIKDTATGDIYYLDIKLYAQGSRDSTFRTFYYEPKRATNKVLNEASHLILGIEHSLNDGSPPDFERWELIDLSQLSVRLKAEFSASNRDLYRPGSIITSSDKK